MQVVIIDDETAFLDVLIKRLVKRGIQATGVDNGQKGILLFKKRPVDIVVLDVCMPGIGGIQTLKRIKKIQPLTQVILLTGHACLDTARSGMDLDAFDYMMKPLEINELIFKLEDAYDKVQFLKKQFEIQKGGA
ncbi:MAG: response regulator [Desulfobacteraceae bacterium]|nr:response regulator [Desulfobacteraceae bacterium]